jgi:ABC-2 type transport system permease protein
MNKIWIVIKREYIQHVRTKGFVISTVLGPVLMIALMVVPILLAVGASGEKSALAVVDRSGISRPSCPNSRWGTGATGTP